jgi:hypothetical protein
MILHAPLALAGGTMLMMSAAFMATGHDGSRFAALGIAVLVVLALERLVSGIVAAVRFEDWTGLLFAPIHLLRDLAWSLAIVTWCVHRVSGRQVRPGRSMLPRQPTKGLPL